MDSIQPTEPLFHPEVKRSNSGIEEPCENETSTANSLLSIERLQLTSPQLDSKPSEISDISLTANITEQNPTNEAPTTPSQAKCPYCDESHPQDAMAKHQDNCEKRNIVCEACGETVQLDIFDFHLEICAQRVEANELYASDDYFYSMLQNNVLGSLPPQEPGQGQEQEQEEPNQENGQENAEEQEGEPMSDEEEDDIDLDSLTYEQLMTLDNTIVKKGMTDKEMESFPIDVFIQGFDEDCSCSVCISELESGEITRKLTCGHKFHRECIDTWLLHNITCPVCKKYLR